MSAKDKFHYAVKVALEKDGWTITDDPLYIPLERITGMYIDLGAEKLIVADKENQQIAVEVKSFLGASTISEFHTAIGQFTNYRYALADYQPERILFLAISNKIYEDFFTTPFIQSVIQRSQINLLIFNPGTEEIVAWKK
ncbi:XisH family protein [Calothrix sp. 336/3]|uniref:XisH family protein n=1 Tax=Calothrix sp. 336/3 TaxID=1337936 RepID=UPI0004E36A8B|nr:XisH family protein [Calothrix sp. 336/3]AKG22099.1 fatty-acid oxidation protein subunit alpha [Calothrix sp. 336/3]